MWPYYLLKGYALVVGVALLILGVLEATSLPPNPEHPEYVLHLGAGALFVIGGWIFDERTHLRSFVGVMDIRANQRRDDRRSFCAPPG